MSTSQTPTLEFIKSVQFAKVLHIWTEVYAGRGRHGSFLKAFAEAFITADPENAKLLAMPAVTLIMKYDLIRYLDTFKEEAPR